MRGTGVRTLALWAAACCATAACQRNRDADDVAARYPTPPLPMPVGAAAVPEGPYPGIAVSAIESTATNPYTNDPAAIKRGQQLFLGMNCAGCHGQEAKKGIFAPNLTDNYWRYGGSDADVFNSIYEGRARGMPAWGAALSHEQIWDIVAYIHSLGGMTGPRLPSQASTVDTAGATAKVPSNKRQP